MKQAIQLLKCACDSMPPMKTNGPADSWLRQSAVGEHCRSADPHRASGLHLTHEGYLPRRSRRSNPCLIGWDCETTVWFRWVFSEGHEVTPHFKDIDDYENRLQALVSPQNDVPIDSFQTNLRNDYSRLRSQREVVRRNAVRLAPI
jgi:hypothetical protein